jgi:hypothetical protein
VKEADMAKKTTKNTANKAKKKATKSRDLDAGRYVIPRGKDGCRVTAYSVELVIPRGKDGCKFTVE